MNQPQDEGSGDRMFRVLVALTTIGYVDLPASGKRSAMKKANEMLTSHDQPETLLTGRVGAPLTETDQVYDIEKEIEEDAR